MKKAAEPIASSPTTTAAGGGTSATFSATANAKLTRFSMKDEK
jgi:hypothetical protein